MTDMLADGAVKVTYAPVVANIAAPKAADELNDTSAMQLECLITADGLEVSVDESVVSVPKLCETFDAESPGRAKYGITLTFVRQVDAVDDKAWEGLPRGTAGKLVIRYGVDADTPYAALQQAMVFPGRFGEQRPMKTEKDGAVLFQQQFYVGAQPDLHAVVAA